MQIGQETDRRSILEYRTFVEGNLVTWQIKKQPVVAKLSAETEFWAMTHGIYERVGLPLSSSYAVELWQ